jgi:hypothetical protein
MIRRFRQWRIAYQDRARLRQLRRQWREMAREVRGKLYPVRLVLKRSLLLLEASEEAGNVATDFCQDPRRPGKLIAKPMPSANANGARRILPRCLVPRRWLSPRQKRKLAIWLLCLLLRAVRLYLGMERRCNRSLTS